VKAKLVKYFQLRKQAKELKVQTSYLSDDSIISLQYCHILP